ncbi:DnaD domain-containing protein [Lacticaseibacillus paracasei]|jgi:DnaD/phage-associated family protein|uniref:DnaD domain-containing protein n=1 Tax=Lacticaseibacillus paracasei TaxID=1597 RepID=UPI0008FF29CC|nr:DnaD domain protein [Lacticaseibacillus paracasei]OJF74736.1 DNA replication protein DnaD [Lacticaseibacillus casei]ATG98271.1 DNA replication protein DnaD [Lacticaseibacillus paracasei]MDE3303998.1 DnaD domain protein [Lacticaseibacillus paracasei]RND78733.1 DnaD domain protein [Lacticaseibacillus paracasei]RND86472.1 DnaD domain protein [Lacticaseibacillus paracasei]
MADGGWIKLYRSIRSNWIWANGNERYAKWWMDLIMMVNHEPRKVLVNGNLITIGVGQRLTSIKKLSETWGTTRRTVDRFLSLLEEDKMIEVQKTKTKGTTIKVLHYADYQTFPPETGKGSAQQRAQRTAQRTTHKQEPKELLKNLEKEKEKKSLSSLGRGDLVKFWENNGFGMISSKTREDLMYWVDDFKKIGSSEEQAIAIVKKALDISVDNNVRRYNYANSILQNWESKKLTSVEAIKALEIKRQQDKQQQAIGRSMESQVYHNQGDVSDDDLPF